MEREQAEFLLNITLNEAKKGYDLLNLTAPSGLMDDIMTLGLVHAQERVLAGERGCAAGNPVGQDNKGDKEYENKLNTQRNNTKRRTRKFRNRTNE